MLFLVKRTSSPSVPVLGGWEAQPAHAAPLDVARADPRPQPSTCRHLPLQVALDEARQALAASQAEATALRGQLHDQARDAAALGAEAVRAGEQLQECRRQLEAVGPCLMTVCQRQPATFSRPTTGQRYYS
jgi:hypothetical protein